ncbi:isopenicillin N synthase family oxygenase [Aquibium carbonis]|uniref:2-oxoglutarate-dependent ethylene/succinate-forming enzyme n=1 Tax=Aquibium carbonis TaxID=2495581 RepID=A0A429YWY6_9HYPH|nr:2OG-Fe(II) oxygenase family protein [Aquibium carbonis]RST85984.1 isopenicillin N synthase family oxygenase [Aquibium carbonis]
MSDFPIFDLSRFEKAGHDERVLLGAEVDDICRQTGFLAIRGHGVPQEVIDGAWFKARAFFDLPADEKQKARAPFAGYPYGYLGPESEALAKSKGQDTPPDLKESFNGGPLAVPAGLDDRQALDFCYAPTIWPTAPDGFRPAWEAYYRAMEDLAARIMRVFAVALKLDEDFFAPTIDKPISALRALNYPQQPVPPKPGQLRAGAHTDYGSLTILLPEAGSGGLEIFTPEGNWRAVPPVAGAFVINIGDLMALWTNDRWVSTLHRVVNPAPRADGSTRRQSFAFFHQPNWHQEIACLPSCLSPGETPTYEPVRSGPYLMGKFQSTVKAA